MPAGARGQRDTALKSHAGCWQRLLGGEAVFSTQGENVGDQPPTDLDAFVNGRNVTGRNKEVSEQEGEAVPGRYTDLPCLASKGTSEGFVLFYDEHAYFEILE